jgi:hypothetical protein
MWKMKVLPVKQLRLIGIDKHEIILSFLRDRIVNRSSKLDRGLTLGMNQVDEHDHIETVYNIYNF